MALLAILAVHYSPWWLLMLPALGFVSLADLTTPLTTDEVKTSIYNVLASTGVNTTTWKPGAVTRTIITACAILVASLSSLVALIAAGGFLETAARLWLTLVARYVYGVERELATFAAGEYTLTNTGGGVFALDAGDLIVSNPDTGKTYRNTSSFALGALETLTIPIAGIEAGSASSAIPNSIVAFETPLLGVTGTNAASLVGLDDETDPALKTRCAEKLGALSPNGPWDAYTYVARAAKRQDGSPIGVTRAVTTRDGYGNVNLYVATASGGVTGTADDPTTDLGAISYAIQRSSVPLAVTGNVLTATAYEIDVTYQAWLYNTSGRNEAEVLTAVQLALGAFMSAQPIGGNVISGSGAVYLSAIQWAIMDTFPGVFFRVVVTVPPADLVLTPVQVPVLGSVAGTITFVSPADGV